MLAFARRFTIGLAAVLCLAVLWSSVDNIPDPPAHAAHHRTPVLSTYDHGILHPDFGSGRIKVTALPFLRSSQRRDWARSAARLHIPGPQFWRSGFTLGLPPPPSFSVS